MNKCHSQKQIDNYSNMTKPVHMYMYYINTIHVLHTCTCTSSVHSTHHVDAYTQHTCMPCDNYIHTNQSY